MSRTEEQAGEAMRCTHSEGGGMSARCQSRDDCTQTATRAEAKASDE